MEEKELYPKGTVQQTEDFAVRQKIKKFVGENVEQIIKEETIDAFKKLGYEEKDSYMYVIAAGGKDGGEKEIGKGTKEGKLNVTVSIPKMLNMGAVKPVSYMQKVTTFGGKKIVSEIYLEIIDKTVHIDYKNTEASAFHQSSEKDTYAPRELSKSGTISGLENEKTFKKDFKDFFAPIAVAEAKYLAGTKIANDDKTEKNMNDSIVKENKYSMKLTNILSDSFEDAGKEIENILKEPFDGDEPFKADGFYTVSNSGGYEIMLSRSGDAAKVRDAFGSENPQTSDWLEIEYIPGENTEESEPVIDPNGYNIPLNQVMKANLEESKKETKTPKALTDNPTDKKLVIGNEEKIEDGEKIEEITDGASGGAGGSTPGTAGKFGYDTPYGFSKNGKTPDLKANKDYTPVQMNESIKDTTYGLMRTPRPHLTRQDDGSYKIICESAKTPYSEVVPMGKDGWPPKGMEHPYTLGMHGTEVNSDEELKKTGHGELSKLEKENEDKKKIEEDYNKKLDLYKRKFITESENKELGVNKRYIITEKLTQSEQSKRWKKLYECDCFCDIKDNQNMVSGNEYESRENKEFEANNAPLESDLCNTVHSGSEEGYQDVPKAKGSMIVFRLSESDVRQNKMYLIDHFTKKLVYNPLYKSE